MPSPQNFYIPLSPPRAAEDLKSLHIKKERSSIPPTFQPYSSSASKGPGHTTLRTVRDHTSNQLNAEGDEYIPQEFDDQGEKKFAPNGALLGEREYRCRTFLIPERGDKLFMLATECARVLGYRDSYLLFNKNRSLFKIIANKAEKDHLIAQDILPYSYRLRQIAIVTARSMFRQFGSRLIQNGRRVRDDYWEAKAIKQGFTEEDPAGEKRPGAARQRAEQEAAEAGNRVPVPQGLLQGQVIYSNVSEDQRPRTEVKNQPYMYGLAHTAGQSYRDLLILNDNTLARAASEFIRNLEQQRAARAKNWDDIWATQTPAGDSGSTPMAGLTLPATEESTTKPSLLQHIKSLAPGPSLLETCYIPSTLPSSKDEHLSSSPPWAPQRARYGRDIRSFEEANEIISSISDAVDVHTTTSNTSGGDEQDVSCSELSDSSCNNGDNGYERPGTTIMKIITASTYRYITRKVLLLLSGQVDFVTHPAEHERAERPNGSTEENTTSAKKSSSNTALGKRKREKHSPDEPEDSEEDDEFKRRRKGQARVNLALTISLRLACPYYKHNPLRYQIWRSCAGPGWDTVHRVKEHVYRRHALPITCTRCCSIFQNEQALKEHTRMLIPCQIGDGDSIEGYDKDQEKRMRSRKRPPKQTEFDRWNEMFTILFPLETNIPSPYYDLSSDVSCQDLTRFKDYMIDKLPERIRGDIESDERLPSAISDMLRTRLTDLIRDSVQHVFQAYQTTTSELDRNDAGPATHHEQTNTYNIVTEPDIPILPVQTMAAHDNPVTHHSLQSSGRSLTDEVPVLGSQPSNQPVPVPLVANSLTQDSELWSEAEFDSILRSMGPFDIDNPNPSTAAQPSLWNWGFDELPPVV